MDVKKRIQSIDILRGIVMVLMTLDHVRDYFHVQANIDNPLNLESTSVELFFTRWITHFCAPIFVFLSGTSIFLQSQRKTRSELAEFLLKRGFWLILMEFTIVGFGWTFNPRFEFIPFQVIWAIGASMVVMGLLIWLRFSFNMILALGIVIVFGHNLLDYIESAASFKPNLWWDLMHRPNFDGYKIFDNHIAFLIYPFPVWTGVMLLGYCAGKLYTLDNEYFRKKVFVCIGFGALVLFMVLRFFNLYGDPFEWSVQRDTIFTILSFIKVHKYPPSLHYLCITLGVACLLLAILENVKSVIFGFVSVFGRVAFFFYIIHIYAIHFIAALCFLWRGHTWDEGYFSDFIFLFVAPGEGYSLSAVYFIWLLMILILFPICKGYDKYKLNHPEKWWLSYL